LSTAGRAQESRRLRRIQQVLAKDASASRWTWHQRIEGAEFEMKPLTDSELANAVEDLGMIG
jgi:hypothetical protein